MGGEVGEGQARVVGRQRVPRDGRREGRGGGQRQGVGGGRPHPLLVHAGLVPGCQLLHPEAGVGAVLGRQRVEGGRPEAAHVGRRRGAQLVQERRERTGTAATAL